MSGGNSNETADELTAQPVAPRRRPRPTRQLFIGLGSGLLLGAVTAGTILLAEPFSSAAACDGAAAPLRVLTVPELANHVGAAVEALRRQDIGGCPLPITIKSEDPAKTAANLVAERGDRPDVWVPDSSVWAQRATRPGSGVPADNPSIATSPIVLAVDARTAQRLGGSTSLTLEQLVPAPSRDAPAQWVLPEPEGSAATVGALLELQDAVAGRSSAAADFGTVVSTSAPAQVRLDDLTARRALPVTEQQLLQYNRSHSNTKRVPAYAAEGFRFDFPYIVLATDRIRRDRSSQLLQVLHSELGQQLLSSAGFRRADGTASPTLTDELGAASHEATVAQLATAPEVNSAIRAYTSIIRPSRLLAVLDVSGSMAKPVPGAGGATRLDLAVRAALNGLAIYTDDTMVGVWTFATNLTPTTDHVEMAPLQVLGRGEDGVSGRRRVADVLGRIRPAKGGTGLNDTVLAAVREVRRSWDAKRVNSVVVITDGGNADRDGISTRQLLRLLRAEQDPDKPVAVFAIAYGPSGDLAALQRIAAVTGGRAYAAPDPRQISQVLADAIGRRSCTPDC